MQGNAGRAQKRKYVAIRYEGLSFPVKGQCTVFSACSIAISNSV